MVLYRIYAANGNPGQYILYIIIYHLASNYFMNFCFSVDRSSDRDLYPDLWHHVGREPAVDPESGQELPLLLLRSDGHVRIYGSVWRILCRFLCRTSPVRSEKERREAQICWSHDQTSPTHLLMRSRAITDIIILIFSCYWTVYQCIFFRDRYFLSFHNTFHCMKS